MLVEIGAMEGETTSILVNETSKLFRSDAVAVAESEQ